MCSNMSVTMIFRQQFEVMFIDRNMIAISSMHTVSCCPLEIDICASLKKRNISWNESFATFSFNRFYCAAEIASFFSPFQDRAKDKDGLAEKLLLEKLQKTKAGVGRLSERLKLQFLKQSVL